MPRTPAGGFVLVGVVMFVLALTILGLSLFTLSSYEAQSLTQSHARQQGSYDAESGIEMVKALIMTGPGFSLASAGAAVGSFNVITAVAKQHRAGGLWDSTGVVTGDSTVWIRVTSQNYGERKTLEARFRPNTVRDYYKRLFTIANNAEVENNEVLPGPTVILHPASQLKLSGTAWQFVDAPPADTAWATSAQSTWNQPHFEYTDAFDLTGVLPMYAASHPTSFTPTLITSDNNLHKLLFDKHAPGTIGYYSSPAYPGGFPSVSGFYTFEEPRSTEIEVVGNAVWIVPAGVQFKQQVRIRRKGTGPPPVLIIVAGRNNQNPASMDGAIHFQGGFTVEGVDDVSVILVTDAKVLIEFANEANTYECRVDRLSILCRDLLLQGPKNVAPIRTLQLVHNASMDAVIDALYNDPSDPLPRPTGSASSLTLIRGSWRSATP